MCGINGFNWEDKELIKDMTDSISHRGPDQHGYYTDSLVSLGHRRLSIIDLSENGRQPMSNEDGKILIIYNGEIYNFKDIKIDLEKKRHKIEIIILKVLNEHQVMSINRKPNSLELSSKI